MVIADVFSDQSSQVNLVAYNHVIQQVSATAFDPTFGHSVAGMRSVPDDRLAKSSFTPLALRSGLRQ